MTDDRPLARRIGLLVPASNSNAEPLTAAVLSGIPHVEVFATRFRLPPSLSAEIDDSVLGESVSLIAEIEPDVVAFHGTAGSWTGIERDRRMAGRLAERTGAQAGTTATQAMVAALRTLRATRISLVFPGSSAIVDGIADELSELGIEVAARSALASDLTNPEIAALSSEEVARLVSAGIVEGIDAVLCVGTNLRAGYLLERLEQDNGLPIIDSAVALAWHALRLAGIHDQIPGWGSLLRMH
ncbi:hypothetical protein [Pseudarthrobacter sp. SSS035]|uniref:maleate cis-trans isomerase family protein n=1 Tax=Pseudarthrobacter sp. SSS035 TaxID=2931399 RepID=UPI0020107B71|nr:hypothetical protein [Pseudarthrobacter sp. SSS035]